MDEGKRIRFKIYCALILISCTLSAFKGDGTGFWLSAAMLPMALYGVLHEEK
jgi:hypothetical protein